MRTFKTAVLTSVLALALGASTAHAASAESLSNIRVDSTADTSLVVVDLSNPDAKMNKSDLLDLLFPTPKPPKTSKAKSKK